MNRILVAAATVAALSLPQVGVNAQTATDGCVAVLALAGRDLSSRVDSSELRSFLYKSVCGSSGNSLGISYEDAARLIGLNYGSHDDYCNSEKQFQEIKINNQLYLSTVVRESVQAWLQCKQFKTDEIELQVTPGRTDAAFSLRRLNTGAGIVYGVEGTNDTRCSASFLVGGKPKTIQLTSSTPFELPTIGAASVYCSRSGRTDASGGTVYPETTVTIKTTAKNFVLRLPEESLLPTQWASLIDGRMTRTEAMLGAHFKGPDLVVTGNAWSGDEIRVSADDSRKVHTGRDLSCPDGYYVAGVYLGWYGTCRNVCDGDGGVLQQVVLKCRPI